MKRVSLAIGVVSVLLVTVPGRLALAGHPAMAAGADTERSMLFTGTVTEVLSGGGYTYLHLRGEGKTVWAACPPVDVKTGEVVVTPPGLLMKDFSSKALNRKFEAIFFIDGIQKPGSQNPPASSGAACPVTASGALPPGHGMKKPETPALSFDNIQRAEGGCTVAELYAGKAKWVGKEVTVRGRVAKFSGPIMDRNWIHIQDGTGEGPTRDLTATSTNIVKVGALVVVSGTVATNKVFGHNYSYEVLLENARFKIESP